MEKIARINKIYNIVIINTCLSDKIQEMAHSFLGHNNTGGTGWDRKSTLNKTFIH